MYSRMYLACSQTLCLGPIRRKSRIISQSITVLTSELELNGMLSRVKFVSLRRIFYHFFFLIE